MFTGIVEACDALCKDSKTNQLLIIYSGIVNEMLHHNVDGTMSSDETQQLRELIIMLLRGGKCNADALLAAG